MGGKAEGRLVVSPIRLPFLAAAYKNKAFFFKTIFFFKNILTTEYPKKNTILQTEGSCAQPLEQPESNGSEVTWTQSLLSDQLVDI